jgi:hypothetical protein
LHVVEEGSPDEEGLKEDGVTSTVAENSVGGNEGRVPRPR